MDVEGAACFFPLVDEANYPPLGGAIDGRFCAASPLNTSVNCCLPCPAQRWIYSDHTIAIYTIQRWISLLSLILVLFLLVSFAVLPPARTQRHWLTVNCLAAAGLLHGAFFVPLIANPPMCYDAITPNDFHTNTACGFSAFFLLTGGMGVVVWLLLRILWLHLHVCWEVVPADWAVIAYHVAGWGIPIFFLILCFSITGVSYRLGNTCLPNHHGAIGDFMAWILGFAGLALCIQLATCGYCILVYLRTVLVFPRGKWWPHFVASGVTSIKSIESTNSETELNPARSKSALSEKWSRGISAREKQLARARHTWRKVRVLLMLQWRSLLVGFMVVAETAFFIVCYIEQDNLTANAFKSPAKLQTIEDWAICLIEHGGDKTPCLGMLGGIVLSYHTLIGAMVLLATIGLECFVILGPVVFVKGWLAKFGVKRFMYGPNHDVVEPVVLDA